MRLITWNTAARSRKLGAQARFLEERVPDVIALQEVSPRTFAVWQTTLPGIGLPFVRSSLPDRLAGTRKRHLGVLIASRFPLGECVGPVAQCPWEEKSLSLIVESPFGPIALHAVHVPPGSSNGWVKVETLEAISGALARHHHTPTILAGDFNTPQCELADGTVITWAQRVNKEGRPVLRKTIRGGSGQRWDSAERDVLVGLREFGLRDVFRALHGYEVQAASWVLNRKGMSVGRRFDHVFASPELLARRCEYLHGARTSRLSDHAALEVDFGPEISG